MFYFQLPHVLTLDPIVYPQTMGTPDTWHLFPDFAILTVVMVGYKAQINNFLLACNHNLMAAVRILLVNVVSTTFPRNNPALASSNYGFAKQRSHCFEL
jgi:hypothetical protein